MLQMLSNSNYRQYNMSFKQDTKPKPDIKNKKRDIKIAALVVGAFAASAPLIADLYLGRFLIPPDRRIKNTVAFYTARLFAIFVAGTISTYITEKIGWTDFHIRTSSDNKSSTGENKKINLLN